MAEFNPMQQIKHQFYAMRNGAIADNMRRQGAPYRIIFGVNLPQLNEIARNTAKSAEMAEALWNNTSTRESMLLAPMIYPHEQYDIATARRWCNSITTPEVADILCMKLLRHMDFASELADELILSENDMVRYTALRLMFNLLPNRITEVKAYAESEMQRGCNLTASVCRPLLDEISFLEEDN